MRILNKIINPFNQKLLVRFILFATIISSYNLIVIYFVNLQGYSYDTIYNWRISPRPLFSFILFPSLLYTSFIFLGPVLKSILMWIIIPLPLLNTLLIWVALVFKSGLNLDFFLILKNTNSLEAYDFFIIHWDLSIWLIITYLAFYFWFKKEMKIVYNRSILKTSTLYTSLALITLFFCNYTEEKNYYFEITNRYYPNSMIGIAKDYYNFQNQKNSFLQKQKGFTFNAKKDEIKETEIYIFFIGESTRADHFGLNDKSLKTTPLLNNQQGLVNFSNAAAQASHTMRALPMLLTRATPFNYNLSFEEKSVISAYREAGFKTSWISSQAGYVFFDEDIYDDSRCYEADQLYFCNKTNCNDIVLANEFKNQVKKIEPGGKYFFILHGYGSHSPYHDRYPASYQQNESSTIIDHYDNSILYTDFIVNEVIETVKSIDALSFLLYTSDHGDNLGDDNRNLYFHSDAPTSYASHVPFFIWLNQKYSTKFEGKSSILGANRNKKVSNDNVFQTLLDLSHIKYPDFESEKSLCDTSFQESNQVIYIDEFMTTTLTELRQSDAKFK